MTEEQERLLREIHDKVVKGRPANIELHEAALAVVSARYRGASWDELKGAIAHLANALERNQK